MPDIWAINTIWRSSAAACSGWRMRLRPRGGACARDLRRPRQAGREMQVSGPCRRRRDAPSAAKGMPTPGGGWSSRRLALLGGGSAAARPNGSFEHAAENGDIVPAQWRRAAQSASASEAEPAIGRTEVSSEPARHVDRDALRLAQEVARPACVRCAALAQPRDARVRENGRQRRRPCQAVHSRPAARRAASSAASAARAAGS